MKKLPSTLLVLVLAPFQAFAADRPEPVSLVSLISHPEDFDGKFVQVEGFLHVRFEDSALYLTEEHAKRAMGIYGVWVDYKEGARFFREDREVDIGSFDGKWVLLEGVFCYYPGGGGHMSAFAGELVETDRILELRIRRPNPRLKDPRQPDGSSNAG